MTAFGLMIATVLAVGGCAPDSGAREDGASGAPIDSAARADSAATAAVDPAAPGGAVERPDGTGGAWARARRAGVDVRALGQEPGWFVEITHGGEMVVVTDYGQDTVRVAAPPPVEGPDGRQVYRVATANHDLTVVLAVRSCRDVMSGAAFPLTVTLCVGGSVLEGCGRPL